MHPSRTPYRAVVVPMLLQFFKTKSTSSLGKLHYADSSMRACTKFAGGEFLYGLRGFARCRFQCLTRVALWSILFRDSPPPSGLKSTPVRGLGG